MHIMCYNMRNILPILMNALNHRERCAEREAQYICGAGRHPVDQLTNIVLEGHGVSHVTSGVDLAGLCPS